MRGGEEEETGKREQENRISLGRLAISIEYMDLKERVCCSFGILTTVKIIPLTLGPDGFRRRERTRAKLKCLLEGFRRGITARCQKVRSPDT